MRYCISIIGKVQKVYFRRYTELKANELGLKGFVENHSDGSVYCEAEGDESQLNELVQWCHRGSPSAVVESVAVLKKENRGYNTFEQRRS